MLFSSSLHKLELKKKYCIWHLSWKCQTEVPPSLPPSLPLSLPLSLSPSLCTWRFCCIWVIIPVSTCSDGITFPDPLRPLSEESDPSANLTFLLEIPPNPVLPPLPVKLGLWPEDGELAIGEEVMRGEEELAGGGGEERSSAESRWSCGTYTQIDRSIHIQDYISVY